MKVNQKTKFLLTAIFVLKKLLKNETVYANDIDTIIQGLEVAAVESELKELLKTQPKITKFSKN